MTVAATETVYQVTVEEPPGHTVTVQEQRHEVTVSPDDPNVVQVALRGVLNNSTSLFQVYSAPGPLEVREGQGRHGFPVAAVILGISLTADEAPAGSDIIVDLNKNGSTVFTDQTKRPRILDGATATTAEVTDLDVTSISAGDYLTVDIDQVGSGTAGSWLTAVVRYRLA